jgi:uncharacterized protein
MESKMETLTVAKDTTGNPAPLGLLGFGMTTVLLNLANAGLIAVGPMILSMGIFYGGIAQVIAGGMEWRKNNTFGATAFMSFGMFWLILVALLLLPKLNLAGPEAGAGMGYFFVFWGLFTLFMFFGTLRLNGALMTVFGTLTVLFILLAITEFTGSSAVRVIAGIEGIVCGLSAMYTAFAQILNEVNGRNVLPLFTVRA